MSPQPSSGSPGGAARRSRPREVTMGGFQAVFGSVLALVVLISAAQQLNGKEMTDALADVVKSEQAATLGLTLDGARRLVRYTIMALSVLSVASLVLSVYVLRRHRPSRVGLTVIGAVVALGALVAGPVGWLVTLYIGVSLFLIWSRPARAWFGGNGTAGGTGGRPDGDGPDGPGPGGPGSGAGVGPPRGPRRDVDGVLPPPEAGPLQGPYDGPPPPPPPPPASLRWR